MYASTIILNKAQNTSSAAYSSAIFYPGQTKDFLVSLTHSKKLTALLSKWQTTWKISMLLNTAAMLGLLLHPVLEDIQTLPYLLSLNTRQFLTHKNLQTNQHEDNLTAQSELDWSVN